MRILLAHNSLYYPSHGGGDKSNRLLMEALAARGHAVRVAARGHGADFVLNGVQVHNLTPDTAPRAWFAAQVEAFDPEIILTSTDDVAHLMLEIALRAPRARVVYLVRATIVLPFGPDSSLPNDFQTATLRQADGVVAVSEYVAQYARRHGGLDAIHVPISLLDPGEPPALGRFDNRYVAMVNPCAVKGIAIFQALAQRFPATEFAAVPTWGTTAADLAALRADPNVSVLPPADDIDVLLAQTRVMLVPSLWAEARSRMILESMARGIPVLAADVGGLREAMLGQPYLLPVNPVRHYRPMVDELMVPMADIPPQDIAPWAAALERLLSDRDHYNRLSGEVRRAALEYARQLNVLPFEACLHQVLNSPPRPRNVRPQISKPPMSEERRRLLAHRATALARKALPGSDIEILWDGEWVRRVGPHYFPDPDLFRARDPNWQHWLNLAQKYLRDADDHWFHLYRPQPGDVIVDIGAGHGEDTLAFSRAAGPQGRVWSLEAHPKSFDILSRFCRLNRLHNVTPIHCACMDQPGQVQIETQAAWESSYVRPGEVGRASQTVRGVRFDDLAAEHHIARIDFLKMNIEGAERQALCGAREALRRARYVSVAAHDFRADRGDGEHFRTLDFVRRFLVDAGFEIVQRDDPRYYVPYHVHGVRGGSVQ